MIPVKGYAATKSDLPLSPFEFNRRDPGTNDVQIDIHFCGVCHSDIHTARNEWGGGTVYPCVPGHEIVGKVLKVGSGVKTWKAGDTVGVGCFVDSCRTCTSCNEGLEQYCEKGMTGTYNSMDIDGKTPTYGGYSTQIVVNEKYILRIPEGIPLDKAAPLLCAGITTYSPLMHWGAKAGQKIAVVGLGGLGHMAVKLAHAMGAEVSVLSTSDRKKEDALRFGANHFYNTSNEKVFSELANSFDLILNSVSANIDLGNYLGLLKRDGTMVLLGAPEKPAELAAFPLIMGRKSLAGSLIGGIKETQEMLDFCGKNKIASDIEVIPLSKINDAYSRMMKGDVKYRFVIDMKASFA